MESIGDGPASGVGGVDHVSFPFLRSYESLTTLAPPHEPCVLAGREGFTGHRSDRRNPVLWTPRASLSAHLRWLKIF